MPLNDGHRRKAVLAGQQVCVSKIDDATNDRLGLLAPATVCEDGWVDLIWRNST